MWRIPKWKLSNFRRELVLFVAYPLFAIVMVFLWICPFSIRKKLNTIAGKIYYKYGHKARATALDNIAKAYNDLSQTEVEDMAKAVFNNVASAFLDFFSFVYVNSKKHYFKYIEVEGEENLRRAYDKGKGVICLIPHISSWELSAVTPPMLGYPTVAASKPIKGFLVQKTMVWFRRRRGMINFDRDGSYKKLVSSLKEGKCLILMIDQDTSVKSCFVDFFGRKTFTPLGASRLALDTDAAIVPMAIKQLDVKKYKFTILPELPTVRTDNREEDMITNTQNQSNVIEGIIRKNPTQWVWMHQRWKTSPPENEG